MTALVEIYGSNVFNDSVMRQSLPKDIYKSLRKTIEEQSAARPEGCGCRCLGDERLGDQQRCNPFHPLVPADDRHYRGEA